jgi:peptidyl-prolyl cis-trans isomerase B (cyclophilin B)
MSVAMLADPFPAARAQAVQVLASNTDNTRIPLLVRYLNDGDALVREQVMLAAGRIGPAGLEIAVHGFADTSPVVRQAAVWAACHGGPEAFEPLTKALLTERDRTVLEALLANLWRLEGSPWEVQAARFASHTDAFLRRAAAYSLARTGAPSARAAQRSLATDEHPVIRTTAIRGFGRGVLGKQELAIVLEALDDADWRVRAESCRVLAAHDDLIVPDDKAATIVGAFSSPHPHLAAAAVAAAGRQHEVGTIEELLVVVNRGDPWLAAEALVAVGRRSPASASEPATSWAAAPEAWRRRGAARVASRLGSEFEARAAVDPNAGVRLAWLSSLEGEEINARLEKILSILKSDPDSAVRTQALSVLRSANVAPPVEELMRSYRKWSNDEMGDARAEAVIAALEATDPGPRRTEIFEEAIEDRNPAVRAMIVNGARGLGDEMVLPAREARHGKKWYRDLGDWVEDERWLDVVTERGTFRIRLDVHTAPITSREIWDLAVDGYYDGLDFHRVVPNFVVQGGDSLVPFDSWRVGIATSGPNTGGSQFFVTLLPADHLTGHYTNFGEVVAGRDVLTRLSQSDHIRTIKAIKGPNPPPISVPTPTPTPTPVPDPVTGVPRAP